MESVPERRPELAGEDWRATGLLRVESRLMRTRAVGVRGGLLTLVPFRNTTLLYHAKWQSQTTQDDFSPFFSSVGRTAFGGRPLAFVGRRQRKAPDIGKFFAGQTDSGGEIAPSSRLTRPRARTLRRGGVAHT